MIRLSLLFPFPNMILPLSPHHTLVRPALSPGMSFSSPGNSRVGRTTDWYPDDSTDDGWRDDVVLQWANDAEETKDFYKIRFLSSPVTMI